MRQRDRPRVRAHAGLVPMPRRALGSPDHGGHGPVVPRVRVPDVPAPTASRMVRARRLCRLRARVGLVAERHALTTPPAAEPDRPPSRARRAPPRGRQRPRATHLALPMPRPVPAPRRALPGAARGRCPPPHPLGRTSANLPALASHRWAARWPPRERVRRCPPAHLRPTTPPAHLGHADAPGRAVRFPAPHRAHRPRKPRLGPAARRRGAFLAGMVGEGVEVATSARQGRRGKVAPTSTISGVSRLLRDRGRRDVVCELSHETCPPRAYLKDKRRFPLIVRSKVGRWAGGVPLARTRASHVFNLLGISTHKRSDL